MPKKLLIEGWRGINHSYAMVNQYQLLEFKNRGIDMHHKDVSFYRTSWNTAKNFCGFDVAAIEKIGSIPRPEKGLVPDVTYRIGFPYNLKPVKNGKLFVFGTAERQILTNEMIPIEDMPSQYKSPALTIVTPSNWSKIGFLNAGFDEGQVVVVSHGVDPSIFKPLDGNLRANFRRLLNADDDSFVLLSVGAMTGNKGVDVLLSAYVELKGKYPQLKLILKDQSGLYGLYAKDLLLKYCSQSNLNLESREVIEVLSGIGCITDNLSLTELNGLYNAADCYISPYRAEGFNLPPLEAAAAGTPVIVTKGGATDDYAHPSFALTIESHKISGNNGCHLEPSLDSLIGQIEVLINKKACNINAQKAREFIVSNLSWSVVSDELLRKMELN